MRQGLGERPDEPAVDTTVLEAVVQLLSAADTLIPPRTRQQIYVMLTLLPSVGAETSAPVTVDGRRLHSVKLFEGAELLFEPASGRTVGVRSGDASWQFWDSRRILEVPPS
jgi:hypothetical protein